MATFMRRVGSKRHGYLHCEVCDRKISTNAFARASHERSEAHQRNVQDRGTGFFYYRARKQDRYGPLESLAHAVDLFESDQGDSIWVRERIGGSLHNLSPQQADTAWRYYEAINAARWARLTREATMRAINIYEKYGIPGDATGWPVDFPEAEREALTAMVRDAIKPKDTWPDLIEGGEEATGEGCE